MSSWWVMQLFYISVAERVCWPFKPQPCLLFAKLQFELHRISLYLPHESLAVVLSKVMHQTVGPCWLILWAVQRPGLMRNAIHRTRRPDLCFQLWDNLVSPVEKHIGEILLDFICSSNGSNTSKPETMTVDMSSGTCAKILLVINFTWRVSKDWKGIVPRFVQELLANVRQLSLYKHVKLLHRACRFSWSQIHHINEPTNTEDWKMKL